MKIINNKLKNELNLRTEKDFPIKGIEFIDINPLFIQKNTLNEIKEKFVEEISKYDIDYIIGPEARGFMLGTMIASDLNKGFLPIRKKGKMPPTTVAGIIEYEKEYGKDYLELPKLVNEDYNNKKFYLVDDIYATGNTAKSIKNKIEELGGIVQGIGVIINIKELNNDTNIYSLIDINEE